MWREVLAEPIKPILRFFLFIAFGAFLHEIGFFNAIFVDYAEDISYLIEGHLAMILISGFLAISTGIFAGVLLSRPKMRKSSEFLMQVFNMGSTIPTLAVLALSMSFLGIGKVPAIFALWVATLLPVIRNTYTGIITVSPSILEAAKGMGMRSSDILFKVELPNALVAILAGVRTAMALNIGTAPLAFLIGGGGLGELIFTGIDLNEPLMMLSGAIITALIAIIADYLFRVIEFFFIPKGINPFL